MVQPACALDPTQRRETRDTAPFWETASRRFPVLKNGSRRRRRLGLAVGSCLSSRYCLACFTKSAHLHQLLSSLSRKISPLSRRGLSELQLTEGRIHSRTYSTICTAALAVDLQPHLSLLLTPSPYGAISAKPAGTLTSFFDVSMV